MTTPSRLPSGLAAGNPYRQAGRVAEGDRFIGRSDLVQLVQATWQEPGRPSNLRVQGYHRTGKTSLVRYAMASTPHGRDDLLTVWLDVGDHDSGMDVFRSMIRAVMEDLQRTRENRLAGQGRTSEWAHLEAIASVVQRAEAWYDLRIAVRDFFTALAAAGRHVLVVLDEFDRAASVFNRLAEFQLLRNLAGDTPFTMGLVTISRRDIESIEFDAAAGSTLGGILSTKQCVGLFTDDETDRMLARADSVGIALSPVRQEIIERTGRHPFLLELLCRRVVENWHLTGRLDPAAAYTGEASTFEKQFGLLVRNIDADCNGHGSTLLRALASGVFPDEHTRYLDQLVLMGIASPGPDRTLLFSEAFSHYVLTAT
ncbi:MULTISPECIES: ATP-binding protein [unclassified Streptomyces]|uniref:ATP-binding protein n=1 Tax=unclassified Streptomyces TaxID=2593676 RepID=UPI00117388B9|nr:MULTISPECIES: ATP-binding protein [unclassified Streptomyces]MDI1454370.1 ATP-binding protein [Streptomyces sp. ATE26]GEK00611.1 hypothetical protein TNCT1_28870 [Streptomyces sp. 1-11]